jgi:hypothetical protein
MAAEPKAGVPAEPRPVPDPAARVAAAPVVVPVNVPMVSGTVARGHTVIAGVPGRPHGPGTRVEIPADEEAWLIESGFLVNPSGEPLEPGMGPQFAPNRAMITEGR